MVERFAIVLVALDPTRGSELQKTRPCVVVSPSEINVRLRTVVIAPITGTIKNYPTRITIDQENVRGSIALDQIRAIDKIRIVAKIGSLDQRLAMIVADRLVEFFHY
ncbi:MULTISPECIES: type II toxin-antitoxin system PemK/MazF family toxin [Microcystis]|jgi:mRNA interferase MazF|uniref:type II toxin-antitoxin system PemK/MazF family toxin n=1 Tax=Microcystis TaxID=1125 RepID=UPI00077612E4|nr:MULTISPECIES: type II toxin-antitoxin system PemK/MazF family toxin [Microcystis]NCR75126.1 type II toxin-antitoxin system PemK/MazF family toxin [Microcystis aeruginosa K13-06]KXS92033.1 transcriptional regulator [Microcystis aeruginosa NIES-88]MCA2669263.1 type II toxin-antitoxin system PemK/MazF family toxin [Microcystis sp. M045S2]MCA2715274.1 type II toxin-antitoxin system PemK/MazF family toxin [Microcystis sp. M172S2]MCA2806803.1 type II toxin-antitoxin system PemK/MazF family toxin 